MAVIEIRTSTDVVLASITADDTAAQQFITDACEAFAPEGTDLSEYTAEQKAAFVLRRMIETVRGIAQDYLRTQVIINNPVTVLDWEDTP